jgi:hypothetical protein
MYLCRFCGGKVNAKLAGSGMTCPNCGGNLQESDAVTETVRSAPVQSAPQYSSPDTSINAYPNRPSLGEKLKSCLGTLFGLAVVCGIAGVVIFFVTRADARRDEQYYYDNQYGYEDDFGGYQAEHHEPMYVAPLGREVSWDDDYESYYDRQTDCYFFQNLDVDPPVWQYWFEGISSDYGDYGWLEWDAKEQCWYVQTGENRWEQLPADKGAGLWHFD